MSESSATAFWSLLVPSEVLVSRRERARSPYPQGSQGTWVVGTWQWLPAAPFSLRMPRIWGWQYCFPSALRPHTFVLQNWTLLHASSEPSSSDRPSLPSASPARAVCCCLAALHVGPASLPLLPSLSPSLPF